MDRRASSGSAGELCLARQNARELIGLRASSRLRLLQGVDRESKRNACRLDIYVTSGEIHRGSTNVLALSRTEPIAELFRLGLGLRRQIFRSVRIAHPRIGRVVTR